MSRVAPGGAVVAAGTAAVADAPVHTLGDLLRRAATSDGALCLFDRRGAERRVAWASIHAEARRVAGALAALGLEPGDRVGLVFPTGEGFFHAFFGAVLAGAVPTPLYPPVRLGRLDEYHRRTAALVEAAGCRLVLADRRVRRLLGEAMERARPALGCRTLDDLPFRREPATSEAATSEAITRGELDPPSAGERLGLVQFSSGTTVAPKPVALSHRALLAQVRCLNDFWPDTATVRHRGASWLPLYHDMGLVGCVFPALEKGTDLALLPPEAFVARPALWLRMISTARATVSPAPNFAYSLCLDRVRDEDLDGVDLSCWRVALNGAEAVSARTLDAFAERFRPWGLDPDALTPVYGLAEAALAVTFSDLERGYTSRRWARESLAPGRRPRPDADGREVVSVGRPLPGFAVEVRPDRDDGEASPDGARATDGRVGRVWVRGPSLMDGYLGRPEDSEKALVDGWLDTGDLGFLADGELWLVGRAKDLVVVRGRNLAPEEIEAVAWEAPGARRGCAVAASWIPDGGSDEELIVFVETDRSAPADSVEELPRAVRETVLAAVGVRPDRVEVLAPGTLPRTSSGKLRRAEALRRWLDGALEPPARTGPLALAGALVRSALGHRRARSRRGGAARAGRDRGEETP